MEHLLNFNIELPYQIHQVTSLTLNSVTIPFQSYYSVSIQTINTF